MQRKPKFNGIYLAVLLALVMMAVTLFNSLSGSTGTLKYSQMISYFENNQVTSFDLNPNNNVIQLSLTIGLIKGITTFNPAKGARLATYAARCVENPKLSPWRWDIRGTMSYP